MIEPAGRCPGGALMSKRWPTAGATGRDRLPGHPIRPARRRRQASAAESETSTQIFAISCRLAQIVVRWHAVRNTGIQRPQLGVEVCSQLLGAPLGLC
jgi:hypothetical protein